MRQVVRVRCMLGVIALAGCPMPRPTQVPMRSAEVRAHAGERSDTVAILLPGHGDSPQEFVRRGFVAELDAAGVDVILADAHSGYYAKGTAETRLWTDVIAPARAAGYARVWLVGISMGGLGAVWTASKHPEIDGIVVLAPFLGRPRVLRAIDRGESKRGWWEIEIWEWLRKVSATGQPPIFLGYGEEDEGMGRERLARMLPPHHVFTHAGGHDWDTWTALWHRMAPTIPWRGTQASTAVESLEGPGLQTADAMCREAGYDFAYDPSGIEHEDGDVTIACGRGPGTACDERRVSFCDGGSMIACKRGKLTATDCAERCRTIGDPEGTPRAGGGCETRGDEGLCVCR